MYKMKSLAAFLMLALGAWFCVQALAPQIQSLIGGGGWVVMLIIGAALILGAWYMRRR